MLSGPSSEPIIQFPNGAPCTPFAKRASSTVVVSGPVAVQKIMGRCFWKVPGYGPPFCTIKTCYKFTPPPSARDLFSLEDKSCETRAVMFSRLVPLENPMSANNSPRAWAYLWITSWAPSPKASKL